AEDSAVGIDWPCESSKLAEDRTINITTLRICDFLVMPCAVLLLPSHHPFCVLFLRYRMDLGDGSSRKPDNNGISFVGLVRRNKDIHTSRLCLGKRLRETRHFISRHLPPVRIRKVTVSNERSQLTEL